MIYIKSIFKSYKNMEYMFLCKRKKEKKEEGQVGSWN